MIQSIISRGAEAILIHEKNERNLVIKHRIVKSYRHKDLDFKIRKSRTRKESKILNKLRNVIPVPQVLSLNEHNSEIRMEFIAGKKLSKYIDLFKENKAKKICTEIGGNIAKMHKLNIIHGDLTTSNMIFSEKENKVFFIDFGLGFHSERIEDKAVDLHLLKQALESKHFEKWKSYFKWIINAYKKNNLKSQKILDQLNKVELRGRYKRKK